MIRCRFCGQPNPPGTRFCTNPACGMYQWDGDEIPPENQPQSELPQRREGGGEERPGSRPPPRSRRQPIGAGAAERQEDAGRASERVAVEERPRPSGASRGGRIAVAISLPQTELEVEPPNLVTCEVLIRNAGVLVDQFNLTLEGPAAQWGTIEPASINLYPESAPATALVSFQPPRSPDTPAGPALFAVRATSREDPSVSESVAGVLIVSGYLDVTTALVPRTTRGKKGGEHELTVANRGNSMVRATLLASDPDKQLNFSADPPQLEVPPGSEALSRIEVVPRKRIWVGKPRSMAFVVGAQVNSSPPVRADGRHEQLPVIPSWVVKVASLVLVPLAALLIYLLTTAKVPPVIGLAQPLANNRLLDSGFKPRFENVKSDRPVGTVTETDPPRAAGRVRRGNDVLALVSAGPEPITVPDLTGLDAGVARSQLVGLGLTARSETQESDRVGPGQVFATEPAAGQLMPPQGQVVMRVASGGNLGSRNGIVDFGPVDPTTGFPSWYQDGSQSGLRLDLCLEGPPLCTASKEAFVGSPPDGLAYYWSAQIVPFTSPLNDAPITFRTGLAAAFGATAEAGCEPGTCAERTYSLIEITAEAGALEPGRTYSITHPFGTSTITANDSGAITPEIGREETGCVPAPPAECGWEVVESGRVGPFLIWDREVGPPAPAGFVGDGVTPHRVTGSPTGNNLVRITGPELGDGLVTDQFIVEGRVSVTSAPPPGEAGVHPNPLSLTVPPQRAGVASPPQAVTLRNHGDGNLRVTSVGVNGMNNDDWKLSGQDCTGKTLPSGGTCQVNVIVTPSADGATNGTITVESNAWGAPHTIALAGTGQAPLVEAEPSEIDFGNAPAGVTTAAKSIAIKNGGTADLIVAAAEVTGSDSGDFSITSNACNAKVPPGQACSVKVAFKPTTGGKRNGTLALTHDAPIGGSRTEVALSGTGQAPSSRVGPAALVVNAGGKGTVTVSNPGTTELKMRDIRVEGNSSVFPLSGSCNKGGVVPPGASCTVEVMFDAGLLQGVIGCVPATLILATDDPGGAERRVTLTGRGLVGC